MGEGVAEVGRRRVHSYKTSQGPKVRARYQGPQSVRGIRVQSLEAIHSRRQASVAFDVQDDAAIATIGRSAVVKRQTHQSSYHGILSGSLRVQHTGVVNEALNQRLHAAYICSAEALAYWQDSQAAHCKQC